MPLLNQSVWMCLTFVIFTDCKSCTRPISTNPGSMEAGEYGLTGRTCFLACRLELDAVAGRLWISWCVVGGAGFFRAFHEFAFSNLFVDPEQPASNRRKGAPTASQYAHSELAPTYPHQVYRLVCSHLRNLASAVDQYCSSQPASLIFDPTSECNFKFFTSFESASRICPRERTLR